MRKIFLCITLCCAWTPLCQAQVDRGEVMQRLSSSARVRGRVIDAQTKQPLEEADVQIECRPQAGMILRMSAQTDSLGQFVCTAFGSDCSVRVEMLGYYPGRRRFGVFSQSDTVDVGTIELKPSEVFLSEAVVSAHAKKFVMRGDTVVFNPQAFQLAEGARLQDLIAKLPGVSKEDGQLMWNGKPIRIQMNGADLFSDNNIFTDRLPAEAVDKIKLYNKASEERRHTGQDDGEEDLVLDVEVDASWLERWYGTLGGAYQTPKKYQADADAMFLSTHNPLMAYGNWNNLGEIVNEYTLGSKSLSRGFFGQQQYASLGYKHAWERQADKPLEQDVAISLDMNHKDTWTDRTQTTERFREAEPSTFELQRSHDRLHHLAPTLSMRSTLRPSSAMTLSLDGSLSYLRERNDNSRQGATFDGDPFAASSDPLRDAFTPATTALTPLITSRTSYLLPGVSRQWQMDFSGTLRYWLRDKSSFSLRMGYEYSLDHARERELQQIDYFRLAPQPVSHLQDYLGINPQHRILWSSNLTYQRWVGSHWRLWLTENLSYTTGRQLSRLYSLLDLTDYADRSFADLDALDEAEFRAVIDPANSYDNHYRTRKNGLVWGAFMKYGRVELNATLLYSNDYRRAQYLRGSLDTLALRTDNHLVPSVRLTYKTGISSGLNLSYTSATNLPEVLQTIAYRDDSDPLHLQEGNPLLRNSRTHSLDANYYITSSEKQQNLSFQLIYLRTHRPFQTLLVYQAQTGAMLSKPFNVRDNYQIGGKTTFDRQLGDYFNLRNDFTFSYYRKYAYLTLQTDLAPEAKPLSAFTRNTQRSFIFDLRPRLSYERDNLEVSFGSVVQWLILRNSQAATSYADRNTCYYDFRLDGKYVWCAFEFSNTFLLRGYAGYATAEMNGVQPIWNAKISWKTLRQRLTLFLQADDILKGNRYYSVTANADSRVEIYSAVPHHFLRLGFTYRFGDENRKHK